MGVVSEQISRKGFGSVKEKSRVDRMHRWRRAVTRAVSFMTRIPAYTWGIAIFVVLAGSVVLLKQGDYVKFKSEIDLFGIVGIPLFTVTILELIRTHRLQAAELIRGHISSFLSDEDLHRAFHDLIYQYADQDWQKVKSSLPSDLNREDKDSRTPEARSRVWEKLTTLNGGRAEGSRLYDPDYFQGSKEEERLDTVLHYFDVMAYHYNKGLISLQDITGVAGYHLAVIGSRDVMQYYLRQNVIFWDNLPYRTRVGSEPPFTNLRILLEDLALSNRKRLARQLREIQPGGVR